MPSKKEIELEPKQAYLMARRVGAALQPVPTLEYFKETKTMAALAVLGGLVGGAMILATIRSKRNAKKSGHIQTFKIG
jgi:hypothetical protein